MYSCEKSTRLRCCSQVFCGRLSLGIHFGHRMAMFDAPFIEIISSQDPQRFDQWIKQWGVVEVVAASGKNAPIGGKKDWISVLLYYFPTMHKWATSDVCSQQDADFVFDALFGNLIINDNNGDLAKKCDTVFTKHIFQKTSKSLWAALGEMTQKNHNGLLAHILSHPQFQPYLTASDRVSRKGMRTFFVEMILGARLTEHSAWSMFQNNMPSYHTAWVSAYVDSLMRFGFDRVVNELFDNPRFCAWADESQFVKNWVVHHHLSGLNFTTPPKFVGVDHLPVYYGKALWNTVSIQTTNDVNALIAQLCRHNVSLPLVVVECLAAAERSVKGFNAAKKHAALRNETIQNNMNAVIDRLDDDQLCKLIARRTRAWGLMDFPQHPRVLSQTLHANVKDMENTQRVRKKL